VEIEIENSHPFEESIRRIIITLDQELSLYLDSLNLHFITDKELLEINKEYLKHDYFTDIITFDLRDNVSKEAEIFISIDRVRENAISYNVTENEELSRIVIHGLLHLSGLKDKTEKDSQIMRTAENKFLAKLFHVKPE
jgi:probable rRNA maturation factor